MSIFNLNEEKGENANSASDYEIESLHSYIIPSVISIIFCGLLGIVATVYAILTIQAKNKMDYEKALRYSETAKKWMIAAYILGIVGAYLQYVGRGGRIPF